MITPIDVDFSTNLTAVEITSLLTGYTTSNHKSVNFPSFHFTTFLGDGSDLSLVGSPLYMAYGAVGDNTLASPTYLWKTAATLVHGGGVMRTTFGDRNGFLLPQTKRLWLTIPNTNAEGFRVLGDLEFQVY